MLPRSGFARFWVGQTISVFGSQVSMVAAVWLSVSPVRRLHGLGAQPVGAVEAEPLGAAAAAAGSAAG